ncbi:MAG: hypothetical protein ABL998_01925 [Planctomycetota bacterium]
MSQAPITLQLSADEALVLFEFLGRFSTQEVLRIEDQAEERAPWNLNCLLEKQPVSARASPKPSTSRFTTSAGAAGIRDAPPGDRQLEIGRSCRSLPRVRPFITGKIPSVDRQDKPLVGLPPPESR